MMEPESRSRARALALAMALAAEGIGHTHAEPADLFRAATATTVPPLTADFLGFHAHYLVAVPGKQNGRATPWPDLPMANLRLWDAGVRWADLQPARGQWQWSRMDALMDMARQHSATVVYTLGSTPRWASARPDEPCSYGTGCAAPPADMANFETYVRAVVQRYKGRIQVYELWNEPKFFDPQSGNPRPGGGFYSGTVDEMVQMGRIARRVIQAEDPSARLATPGFDGGPRWLDAYLSAGGSELVDLVTYHFYARDSEDFIRQLADVKAVLRRQGLERLPLWNSESGVEADDTPGAGAQRSKPDRRGAAAQLVQSIILAAAGGVRKFFLYAWDNPKMGLVDPAGQPVAAHAAVARIEGWLAGASFSGCRRLQPAAVACDGTQAGVPFTLAWSLAAPVLWQPAPPASGLRAPKAQRLFDDDPEATVGPEGVRLTPRPLRLEWTH